ncbi:DUF4129 domain-containing protein [Petralouisia muris]|uniref:DUF4129 domain-containing protein n=1 Tax=Petralouisia muris TaxID=3032872 RepID=A0AC61S1M8_9FIRM|nr:transglutaminase domain-containing protein [Petralouisia muris]TGY98099.1 DUF4129 domain-containing protein [Petralouisia muris]
MAANLHDKKASTEYGRIPFFYRLKAGISLFLAIYGIFLCMENLLLSGTANRGLLLLAGLILILTEIMYLGKKQRVIVSLLFVMVLGTAVRLNQPIFSEGGKEIANRVLELINRYYRTEYLTWFVKPEGSEKIWCFMLLCALLGFLESLLVVSVSSRAYEENKSYFKKWKVRVAFLIVPALIFVLGSYVGIPPSETEVLLILAGFLAWNLELKEKGAWIPGTGLAVILVLAAIFSESGLARQLMARWHTPWYQNQLQLEDQLLELVDKVSGIQLFSGNKAQSEYMLGNDKPNQTGKELFRITTDKRPEQTFYIRGFIGGDYAGGSWKAVSKQEFSDWAQNQGISNQAGREAVQNYPYQTLKEREKTDQGYVARDVTIELKNPVSGYTLSPYYSEIPEDQPAEGDGMLSPQGQKEFMWNSFLFLKDWQREGFHSVSAWEQKVSVRDLSGQTEEERIWENYCSYVQQVYTRLPKQGLERVKELAEPYAQLNLWGNQLDLDKLQGKEDSQGAFEEENQEEGVFEEENQEEGVFEEGSQEEETFGEEGEPGQEIQPGQELRIPEYRIMQVKMLLWSNTEYSQNLEPVPEGEDYTEYFLLEQKKGFCVHYATAGTLMLRMLGVPARYVSGYVVFPEDFHKNKDGTFTAVVKDQRGHAWTEVFQNDTGFYPLEVTPPSYLTILADLEPGEDVEEALQEWEQGGEEEALNEPTPESKQQEEENTHPPALEEEQPEDQEPAAAKTESSAKRDENRDAAIPGPVKAASVSLAGIVLICGMFWSWKKYMQRKRQAEFYQENRSKGALAMGKALETLLKSKGLEREKSMGDQEYGAYLAQKLPELEWERAVSIWQKAAFSQQGITEEEFLAAEEFYQKSVRALKK